MLSLKLRISLEEIIEPAGGDDDSVEIVDPNDPQEKSKDDKMEDVPRTSKTQLYDSGRQKMWMTGGNA